jgi:hypothetical protein
MSAPITDLPSSISSSGHIDGLGRRVLAFDRETGAILERLHLRPELAAFEAPIRQRVEQLATFEDERFARPGSVERDPASGDLTVLSEFVAGSRLSDLLETAEESGLVPGVDVALGFLLEALPAISSFHTSTGCSHGLIDSTRLVVTPAGQVIFLDAAFGSVVERLGLTASRLWREFGVASPQTPGPIRLDATADITQVALGAVMLVVGRRLRHDEYPDAIPSLLMEVVEIAQIRGSYVFANSLQRLFQRSLPVAGRRPFSSAEELVNEIRLLLRREIGAEVCRQALINFTEQMDAQFSASRASGPDTLPAVAPPRIDSALRLDQLALDAIDSIEVLDEDGEAEPRLPKAREEPTSIDLEEFEEISLDPLMVDDAILQPTSRLARAEPALRLPELPDYADEPPVTLHVEPASDVASAAATRVTEVADPWRFDSARGDRLSAEPAAAEVTLEIGEPERLAPDPAREEPERPAPAVPDAPPIAAASAAPPIKMAGSASSDGVPSDDALPEDVDQPAENTGWRLSRRLKRQQKSARARKDKLRSATESKPAPQVPAQPAKPHGGWLVNPDRAAAFAAAVPDAAPVQAPRVIGQAAPPPMPVFPAVPSVVPAVAPPAPVAPQAIPMPVYGAPAPPPPPPPAPIRPVAVAPPVAPKAIAPAGAPLRLKAEPPPGYAPPRPGGTISTLPYGHRRPMFEAEPPRGFPWKLAIAAVLIVGIAVVVGRAYIPSRASASPEPEPPAAAAAHPEPARAAMAAKVQTGDIVIETQPAGARVLLDGKPAGQTPLTLANVPVGRHVLTFVSSAGEVTRTVRVASGKSLTVDISIFSGWVAIFAPIVLDVSVNGRSLGTTEQDRLMLPPGRHELTLTNKELGYKAVKEIEVEPGEVRSVTVEPRGEASFNAIPWAEVWMDGKKLGDTPLGNMRVPLGMREFVFKHPQYGERRVTASIRADQPSAIGVDFTRPE